jgi:hypothetical protein
MDRVRTGPHHSVTRTCPRGEFQQTIRPCSCCNERDCAAFEIYPIREDNDDGLWLAARAISDSHTSSPPCDQLGVLHKRISSGAPHNLSSCWQCPESPLKRIDGGVRANVVSCRIRARLRVASSDPWSGSCLESRSADSCEQGYSLRADSSSEFVRPASDFENSSNARAAFLSRCSTLCERSRFARQDVEPPCAVPAYAKETLSLDRQPSTWPSHEPKSSHIGIAALLDAAAVLLATNNAPEWENRQ